MWKVISHVSYVFGCGDYVCAVCEREDCVGAAGGREDCVSDVCGREDCVSASQQCVYLCLCT